MNQRQLEEKKSFIYFIRDMGVLATKEGCRVTGSACVAGGICVRVLYCFCGGVTPAHPASFAGCDKLPDDQTRPTLEMTPGFKPFTARQVNHFCILGFVVRNVPSGEERGETDVFAGYEQSLIAEFSF